MEQRKSGNGVKVAKRVARELAKKIKCYNNSKTQIRNQFCTEVNVKKAGLKYKKDFFPILLEEYEKLQEKRRKKAATKARNALKKEMGARTIAEMRELQEKERKLTEMLCSNFPYRQSESSWVSPENEISISIRKGDVKGYGNSFKIYSDNGKWSGNDSEYRFTIPKNYTLKIVGGMVTAIVEENLKKLVKPCIWWEQGRGFTLKQKRGFVIKGWHTEAATAEKALKTWKAMKKRKRTMQRKIDKKVITVQYCQNHFGWCESGIRNFMKLNNIENIEKITIKELRNIVTQNRKLNCANYKGCLRRLGIKLNCK